jgi:VIT1/CCC1 family predicted Fe2+/Mn2+ transporter
LTKSAGTDGRPERRRVLEPTERSSEILFGLIMVLTFTGSLSAATSAREDVKAMLIGAIGCNLAWGIVDAIMYVMNSLAERGRNLVTLRKVKAAADPGSARRVIADALPAVVAEISTEDEIESMRRRLADKPETAGYASLNRGDLLAALAVFLLVFLSTFPVVIPFFLMTDAVRALRWSNAIALFLLLVGGFRYGQYAGFRPWLCGLAMAAIGIGLVAITIALGG